MFECSFITGFSFQETCSYIRLFLYQSFCLQGNRWHFISLHSIQAGTDANPEAVAKYLKKDLKEYPGLTGKLGFNEKGDRIGDLYKVYEVDGNGGFVLQK